MNENNRNTNDDTPTTINILKALFERVNYCFSSFSSKDHGEIMKNAIKNSQEQEKLRTLKLKGDPILNEFVNGLFSNFSLVNDINTTTNNGMVKYEIYSIQSLNSSTTDNQYKSIWLPKSITICEAHQILSTILYSNNNDTIPADLADYVLVYENIMIPLENQNKELYEEILKISFRLNRVALSPFRLLIVHKCHLLLLERKESNILLQENESISVLQLIMFHLISNNIYRSGNENFNYVSSSSICSTDQCYDYWPIVEIKMGIMPSSKLIHSLKHNKLRQIITNIIQTNSLSIETKINFDTCIELLKTIFSSVNADISYIKLIVPIISKSIQIYDYPLLIALPYDRLLLSQFCKTQCSDNRWAQGIMVNGKYYSLTNNSYTPMSELKINPDSIMQLKFNIQSDTIINEKILSSQDKEVKVIECYNKMSSDNTNKFPLIKYQYSVEFDNNTVNLMFPSE